MPMAVPGCLALVITELVILLPFLGLLSTAYAVPMARSKKGGRKVRSEDAGGVGPWWPSAHFLQVFKWCPTVRRVGREDGCWNTSE